MVYQAIQVSTFVLVGENYGSSHSATFDRLVHKAMIDNPALRYSLYSVLHNYSQNATGSRVQEVSHRVLAMQATTGQGAN